MIDFLLKKKQHLLEIRSELLLDRGRSTDATALRQSVNLKIKLSVVDEELALVEDQIQQCKLTGRALSPVKPLPQPIPALVH